MGDDYKSSCVIRRNGAILSGMVWDIFLCCYLQCSHTGHIWIIKSPQSGMTLWFQFVSFVTAVPAVSVSTAAASTTFASHNKTSPYIF